MHVRQQVRDAAVARLTGLPLTGARVFASRIRPIEQSQLPCLLVQTNDEEVLPATVHGAYARQLQLVVECVAQASGDTLGQHLIHQLSTKTQSFASRARYLDAPVVNPPDTS